MQIDKPFIDKLLEKFPQFDPTWPEDAREAWLDAFFAIAERANQPLVLDLSNKPPITLKTDPSPLRNFYVEEIESGRAYPKTDLGQIATAETDDDIQITLEGGSTLSKDQLMKLKDWDLIKSLIKAGKYIVLFCTTSNIKVEACFELKSQANVYIEHCASDIDQFDWYEIIH